MLSCACKEQESWRWAKKSFQEETSVSLKKSEEEGEKYGGPNWPEQNNFLGFPEQM